MSGKDECPPRGKILQWIANGEYVEHLRECEECAAFVAIATETMNTFTDRGELEQALSDRLDEVLADTYGHRMSSAVISAPELHRSIVVRELLRRAEACSGSNPSRSVDLANAAVIVCDAMLVSGNAPEAELRIEALKQHATALRQLGSLDAAMSEIERAMALVHETADAEYHRAVLSLCAAIVEAEPDRAKFDEAISLAGSAAAVLEICGDERSAVIARQTKAYVLVVKNELAEALPLLRAAAAELDRGATEAEPWSSPCDVAIALACLAHCLVGLGSYDEAAETASRAVAMQTECGRTVSAARAAHIRARAISGLGRFAEVREEFARTADVVFDAKLFDEWSIMRLDYTAAALAADPAAGVRAELESVAYVCLTLSANASNVRRQYAAEAMAYLRQLAIRDAVTIEAVDHVRAYVLRNSTRPPVKFVPPHGGTFLM